MGHTPNHIPASARIKYVLLSLALFAYGTYDVMVNDLHVPGKRRRGIHLHDAPVWVMYGAIICACLVMLSIVVDHYDKRDTEIHYERFARTFTMLGLSFFVLSLMLAILQRSWSA